MSVTIRRLTGAEFSLLVPRLVDIYIEAMGYDPNIRDSRADVWRREVIRPGFTCIIASGPNDVVGLAYGFIGTPDHWWDYQLRRGMRQQKVPESVQLEVRAGYFEVAEIHVRPGLQGHGIGRSLLTELLWNAPAPRALLSTPEVEGEANGAFGLYRSMGFVDLLRNFRYPGDNRPFAILCRDLPLG